LTAIANAQAYWEPSRSVDRPVRGLFDVAEVVDVQGHVLLGAEYRTNSCTAGCAWLDMCDPVGVKSFESPSDVVGCTFAVYDALECELGQSPDEMAGMLRETFGVKAEAVVEAQLQAQLMVAPPAASTSLTDMVADLEEHLAQNYAGRGLLHMDRYTSVQAYSRKLIEDPESHGARVQTINGTPVVLGRGYVRTAGKFWAAASGRVVVLRGPLIEARAPMNETTGNRVLLEQQYVLLVECAAAWTEVAVG
jgi:hypothetical protein